MLLACYKIWYHKIPIPSFLMEREAYYSACRDQVQEQHERFTTETYSASLMNLGLQGSFLQSDGTADSVA